MEVLGGDEPGDLSVDPLLALVVLTVRTVTMASGVRHQGLVCSELRERRLSRYGSRDIGVRS
jgi:hypothetical protein